MSRPIDFVITWVDGSDPEWQKEKLVWEAKERGQNPNELFDLWNNNPIRYRDWENLQYWFRGVEKFAPWVHRIYFLTWGHVPSWLNLDNPKLRVVNHKEFIPEKYLPTFNSHTIEWNMNKLPGLSEQFVYFNDDMFLLRPVEPSDFFRGGLPCETAALDCVALDWNVGHAEIKNTQLLNKYFVKKDVIRKNLTKWFRPCYGKHVTKTLLLMPWDRFTGIYEPHLPISYLKSSFDKIWKLEGDEIDRTCLTKFRSDDNISHWFVKSYQLATGKFEPRKASFGKMYHQLIDAPMCREIMSRKYAVACINDVECSEEAFSRQKAMLNSAFDRMLPERSSFEK